MRSAIAVGVLLCAGLACCSPGDDSGGGAPPLITPADVPGLSLWLEAGKGITTRPSESSPARPIVGWADQSSHHNDASQLGASGPALTSGFGTSFDDVVEFEAGGEPSSMTIADAPSLQLGTGDFAVVMFVAVSAQQPTAIFGKGDNLTVSVDENQNVTVTTPTASARAPLQDSWSVVSVRGPALEIRVYGDASRGTTNTSDLSAPGQIAYIGAVVSANQEAAVGLLEVLLYKGSVSDAQLAELETYLEEKYSS